MEATDWTAHSERDAQLTDELSFWRGALDGDTDYLQWRLEQMLSPEGRLAKFPVRLIPHLEQYVEEYGRPPRVLDVGSGPLSTLAWAVERGLADVTAVDPLAERYGALLVERNFSYPVTPVPGEGEKLTALFPVESFDIVYSRNALDHCGLPHQVLTEAVQVLRSGGLLMLEGAVAEGTQQHWHGLHQHDILPTDTDLLHRDRTGAITSLVSGLPLRRTFSGSGQDAAEPAATWRQNDWYVLTFVKDGGRGSTGAVDA